VREEDEGSECCTKHKQVPQQQQRTREEPDENEEIATLRHFMLFVLLDLAPLHPR